MNGDFFSSLVFATVAYGAPSLGTEEQAHVEAIAISVVRFETIDASRSISPGELRHVTKATFNHTQQAVRRYSCFLFVT